MEGGCTAAEMKSHQGNSALHAANHTAILVGRGAAFTDSLAGRQAGAGTSHLNINNALVASKEKRGDKTGWKGRI